MSSQDRLIRYARNGDVHLAYEVIGDGDRDVLLLPGGTMPMDALSEHPKGLTLLRGLERLGRLILTDQRAIGQSDSTEQGFTPEIEADDLEAVLEASDAQRCVLVAGFDACLAAIACAARRPARLGRLVLVNGYTNFQDAQADREQLPPDSLELFHQMLDGVQVEGGMARMVAPSERGDERWVAWFDAAGRRGASPRSAAQRWRAHETADVSRYLESIVVPTLVIHRERNLVNGIRQGEVLAEAIPDARLVRLPGHDNVIYGGNVAEVVDVIAEFVGEGAGRVQGEGVLAAMLFTDIVASTDRAVALGDRKWAAVLDVHDSLAERVLDRHSGTLVKTTGDGLLVTFPGPGSALRCAAALRDGLAALGLEVRSGIHVGEVQRRGDDVGGIAVHLAARVMARSGPGEILVSGAVPPLMVGSGVEFDDRGTHQLKGIPGSWQLLAPRL